MESKGLQDTSEKAQALAGTWKLVQYIDYDSGSGEWIHTYGENPRGYFTYTKSGVVNLSISSEVPLDFAEDSIYYRYFTFGELLDKSVTYFGHFEIDAEKSVVSHLPEGGSIPWYLGTGSLGSSFLKETLYSSETPLLKWEGEYWCGKNSDEWLACRKLAENGMSNDESHPT